MITMQVYSNTNTHVIKKRQDTGPLNLHKNGFDFVKIQFKIIENNRDNYTEYLGILALFER